MTPEPGSVGDRGASLWRFSFDVYARPGVAAACLELQDRYGADVNMLLALIWHAHAGGGVLGQDVIGDTRKAVAGWQADVVGPLREARRSLKCAAADQDPAVEELRQQVKALELEAERIEQMTLAAFLPRAVASGVETDGAAAANVRAYLRSLGTNAQTATAAAGVLHAAFPATESQAFVSMLTR